MINNYSDNKIGYLNDDFQIFYLKDKKEFYFEPHYHEFNKIVVFISGKVTYLIEGKAYKLKPWDILLVSKNDVHKALIDSTESYERMIIWVNSSFLLKNNYDKCDLLNCFRIASQKKFNLIRGEEYEKIKYVLINLQNSWKEEKFGSKVLNNSLFLQFMVYLNRIFLEDGSFKDDSDDVEYDERIGKIIDYINKNLTEDLSIDRLSDLFYISKYYLMHKFKDQTGYTVHKYIMQKRLIKANSIIEKGTSITKACIESGFSDYSNFVRAFKNMFGISPKKYYKSIIKVEKSISIKKINK